MSAHRLRAAIALAGAGLMLALGAVTATPAAAAPLASETATQDARHRLSIYGSWQLNGTDEGNPVHPKIHFYRDHTLDFVPADYSFVGLGTWAQDRRTGKFTFNQAHPHKDADGVVRTEIRAEISGRQISQDRIAASGTAWLLDLEGNILEEYDIVFEGTRL